MICKGLEKLLVFELAQEASYSMERRGVNF